MKKNTVGILSNDRIGTKLALNLEDKEITTSIYSYGMEYRTKAEQAQFCKDTESQYVSVMFDMESFVLSLASPRRIFLISTGASFADGVIGSLVSSLDAGDIIIDLCDANFKESIKRTKEIQALGIHYLPTGFSGGEHAAEHGLSLMTGGAYTAYEAVRNILAEISAKIGNFACCPYIGPDGSGQYVRMIHDGIEYSMLEIICEAIALTRTVLQCTPQDIAEILAEWNSGEAESYFLDVFCDIMGRSDSTTGQPMSDIVLDTVGYSHSIIWLSENALELSMPIPTVQASLNMRFMSNMKNERVASSKLLKRIPIRSVTPLERKNFLFTMSNAVYLATLCAVTQSFALLKEASDIYSWDLNLLSIAKTFQGNSFIRSRMMFRVIEAYDRKNDLSNLFLDSYFKGCADTYSMDLRTAVKRAISSGIAVPCLSTALDYMDTYRNSNMPTGLIQLVRDYINNIGFERNDRSGVFHGDWANPDDILHETKG